MKFLVLIGFTSIGGLIHGCGLDLTGQLVEIPDDSDAAAEGGADAFPVDVQPDADAAVDGEMSDSGDSGMDSAPVPDSAFDSPIDSPPDSPVVPTCKAGSSGTADNTTASGALETGLLIHYQVGVDYYSSAVPTMKNWNGSDMPGQLVLYGKDGIQFDLKNGSSPAAKPYFIVNLGTLPVAECGGVNLKSQACLAKVAKSFRCQYLPYLENVGCPPPVTFTAQPATNFYQDLTSGHKMLLVHLTCP
jgi:hypothetical protein